MLPSDTVTPVIGAGQDRVRAQGCLLHMPGAAPEGPSMGLCFLLRSGGRGSGNVARNPEPGDCVDRRVWNAADRVGAVWKAQGQNTDGT